MNWTKGQKQAIESLSGDITVAASAGTGKTTVLSQRAVRILGVQELCPDVSDILVLTFTDAAAGEMKQRIAINLKEAAQQIKTAHLRKQLLMLDSADISTIHSFCKRIISQNFHRLGLDPTFRVMDSDESKLIKKEILQRITEQAWDDMPQAMHQLLQGRAVSNPQNNFLNCIIDVSDFLNTVVSRQDWFDRAAVFNEAVLSSSSQAVKNQKQIILEKLKTLKERFEWSLKLDEKITNCHWQEQIQSECFAPVLLAIDFLEKDDLDSFIEILNSFDGFKWNNRPKDCSAESREFVLCSAIKAIKEFKNLSSLAILNPNYQRIIASSCSVQAKALIELVKKFDLTYQTAKQQLSSVDFSDLERYMLTLLSDNGDIDSGKPSDIALQLQKKYKYIFVDEYQDINPVQQRIIDLLSGSAKVFVVGDVKQSIYAWRGADCGLFVQRLNSSTDDELKSRVDLNENFRSRPGILNFVNEVFSRIMTESVAAIDYDEKAALKSFKDSPQTSEPDVELIIVDEESQAEHENANEERIISSDAINRRALTIAQRIKQLVEIDKFRVYDKAINADRPCRFSDVVILTRAFEQRASNYVQVLRLANIPVVSDSSAGYFATTEINDMLSLLQVLDNPRQDIPLAAVLRSPLFGVSESQLSEIKLQSNEHADFYTLLESYVLQNPKNKIADILHTIDDWRTLARQSSLADLIWRIYSHTDYLSFVTALPGGSQRRSNLLKLHQRAIQFENFSSSFNVVSLSRFVDFLQKLLDAGGDWAPAEPDVCAANAVRVMSIHKSKGLEFPIVFLVETNREFQGGFNSKDCITNDSDTIGLKVIDEKNTSKLSSLTWQLIREKQRKQNLSEEMRILYVALTRAKDKLIISGAAKTSHCMHLLSNASFCDSSKLPKWLIEDAKNELDWILLSLAPYTKLSTAFKLPLAAACKNNNLFDFKIYAPEEISQLENQLLKKRPASRYESIKAPLPDKSLLERINQNINWHYPFSDCSAIKAKQSVTSIAHEELEFVEPDYKYVFDSFDKAYSSTDSLVVGSATHLVIKNINLKNTINESSIQQTINDLVSNGSITKHIAGKINIRSIISFFNGNLGNILLDKDNTVMREWPFTYAASVSELYPDLKNCIDENIIVQGIIDMLIKTPDGAVIIDFKTDRIKSADVQHRTDNYAEQLRWYCRAAGEILNLKNVSGWLYFLAADMPVKIN